MARITPGSTTITPREDFEPYPATLQSFELGQGQYGPDIKFVWEISDDQDDTLWTWAGLKIGKSRDSGKVSRFRAVLNALFGRPETAEIGYFDDETFEVGFGRDGVDGTDTLRPGLSLILRGRNVIRQDGSHGWQVEHYAPAKPGERPLAATLAADVRQAIASKAASFPPASQLPQRMELSGTAAAVGATSAGDEIPF